MTPAKFKAALESVNAVARKVFDHTPIQESWPVNKIIGAMVTAGTTRVDLRTAEGCIERLKDAGLVKETDRGLFQRVVPRERETITLPSSVVAAVADDAPAPQALALGDLSAILRARATDLLKLADDIDNEALRVEERVEAAEQRVAKFREFTNLIKNF